MPNEWRLKASDLTTVPSISSRFSLPEPLARLIAMRSLEDMDAISAFLSPELATLSDPYLLPDMERAVQRMWRAIDSKETIVVFGDYDVDGVTSGALMTRMLRALGAHVTPFIPDRLDEGYGLSSEALNRCLDEYGCTLVITVDCGVNAVESVAEAQGRGVDVIVTDHHEPAEETAGAYALVNPKLGKVESLKILAGVGVAFKVAHGLIKWGRQQQRAIAQQIDLRHYLDLAALGTVADIVPLIHENRVLVKAGLTGLNASHWPGMRALIEVAGVRGKVDTYHLGFQLGPRINAAGRIGQPMEALELLTTDDATFAHEIAVRLNQTNIERREVERRMAEEAFEEIDRFFDPTRHFGLVVARENWHPGVVGIVASRISRQYNRPTIVLSIDADGTVRGSCRSIEAYDLLEGLNACSDYLVKYGGHKMAAGATVIPEKLSQFREAFDAEVARALTGVNLEPIQWIDGVISIEALNWTFMEQLKRLQPFGQDNPEPIWCLHRVAVCDGPYVVGREHLRFSIATPQGRIEAIAFNCALDEFPAGPLDLALTFKENEWNGSTSLQLQVKSMRSASESLLA